MSGRGQRVDAVAYLLRCPRSSMPEAMCACKFSLNESESQSRQMTIRRSFAKKAPPDILSWKCRRFKCRPQLVLTTCFRVFPTRLPDRADVSVTSCDVGFFFSVSYVVSLTNCRHVVVVTTHLSCLLRAKLFSCSLWYSTLI